MVAEQALLPQSQARKSPVEVQNQQLGAFSSVQLPQTHQNVRLLNEATSNVSLLPTVGNAKLLSHANPYGNSALGTQQH